MTRIVIATCNLHPELTASDRIFADALARHGLAVSAAPWNGDFAPFVDADLTIIRSTWDYIDTAGDFRDWAAALATHTRALNPPATLQWNMTKAYLFELAEKGAPTPPLQRAAPTAASIAAAMDALDLDEAIVKPICGAGASGLSKISRREPDGFAHAAAILNGDAVVQPFIPEIATAGETSLVFFGGAFSHAVLKTPKPGDIRVQEEHGGASRLIDPPQWAIDGAARILAMCPEPTAYARIDVVIRDDAMVLMEVELVEPELFFPLLPKAGDRLADVVMRQIANQRFSIE